MKIVTSRREKQSVIQLSWFHTHTHTHHSYYTVLAYHYTSNFIFTRSIRDNVDIITHTLCSPCDNCYSTDCELLSLSRINVILNTMFGFCIDALYLRSTRKIPKAVTIPLHSIQLAISVGSMCILLDGFYLYNLIISMVLIIDRRYTTEYAHCHLATFTSI